MNGAAAPQFPHWRFYECLQKNQETSYFCSLLSNKEVRDRDLTPPSESRVVFIPALMPEKLDRDMIGMIMAVDRDQISMK